MDLLDFLFSVDAIQGEASINGCCFVGSKVVSDEGSCCWCSIFLWPPYEERERERKKEIKKERKKE